MAREIVTNGGRFYCVSLSPDICKTPVGGATPPIPYQIKGEFADAAQVSRNIKSNGEPVVLSDSSLIPSVTGDEPGSAKGIKSGTVGKRVQHDAKSKSVKFNGQHAVREGDVVWMNDKNTQGKIFERGNEGAKPRIQITQTQTPTQEKSVGDKIDEAVNYAADKINAGEQWLGDKVNQFAQTPVGGKIMEGVKRVSDKTELTSVKEWKEGLAQNVETSTLDGSGGAGMAAAGAVTEAALEFIPTNLLDLIPGGGKAAGEAGKVVTTAAKLEHAASKTEHLASDAAKAADKAEHAAKEVNQAEHAAPVDETANNLHAEGADGGKSKGKRNNEAGKCGEWLAKMQMTRKGYTDVVSVQNSSGHGNDLIGRNPDGSVLVWEVKATETQKAPALKGPQRTLGGEEFTKNRLARAIAARGHWSPKNAPGAIDNAKKAEDWLARAKRAGKPTTYEKREVFVDDLEKGCHEHPVRESRSKSWLPKTK